MFLPDAEQREFLAANVCGDRKSVDGAPLVVQGGAAICWSSRVTRNWMPGHGSLSNISRLNIATGNRWWRQCAQSSTMRKYVKLCTPIPVLAHCWNSTVCSRSGHLNSHKYFLFITVYCYVATIDLNFLSYAIFCTVANCPLNLAYFNAIVFSNICSCPVLNVTLISMHIIRTCLTTSTHITPNSAKRITTML